MNKAIFLDRDGVLNVDKGYVYKREDWEWLPGSLEALRIFRQKGYSLIVVSNQSGIGRGFYTMTELLDLEDFLNRELEKNGLKIDAWYYCPHLPDDNCNCRKPEPGLLRLAISEHAIDSGRSWLFGDRLRDVQAGIRAGCKTGLVFNPDYTDEWKKAPSECARIPNLLAAARMVE